MLKDQVEAAPLSFVCAGDREPVTVLMKPSIPSVSMVNVQHIDAANHSSRDADQWAGIQRPKARLGLRVCAGVFETVGRGWAFVEATWETV